MDITLNELYQGHPCIIKNKEYFAPRQYVEPFIERMSKLTDNYSIQVKEGDMLSTTNKKVNNIFTRVVVQAVLPNSYTIDEHSRIIGLVYGLDVKKPVVSLYKGYINSACTNLTIFNPSWINTQELIAGDPINYNPINEIVDRDNNFEETLKKLKQLYISREDRKNKLGLWIDNTINKSLDNGFGKIKLATSVTINAYKSLFIDSNSDYYILNHEDPSMFEIYNAFTQCITDDKKDIIQTPYKTLLVSKILELGI